MECHLCILKCRVFFQCLGSSVLLNWYGYQGNSSFNKTQLESLLSGVVYFLTPINQGSVGAVCNKSIAVRKKNLTQDAFHSLVHRYGDGHGSLEEKQIDKLLEDVNSTLKFRLTKKPVSTVLHCFVPSAKCKMATYMLK